MSIILNKINQKQVTWLINGLVALFFITVLLFKKGYSYVPMTLGGVSLIYAIIGVIKFRARLTFSAENKALALAFLVYFATFLVATVVNQDNFREIDNPSRVLLFIPLLLLFNQFPLKLYVILRAIPAGAMVVGFLALYQKFYVGMPKIFPDIMRIQAGNISLSLAMLSLVIAIYFSIKKSYRWALFASVGALLGMMASLLSGARGGWIAVPTVILVILFCYRHYINKKILLGGFTLLALLVGIVATQPKFGVIQRYNEAKEDITKYIEKNNKRTSLGARFDMWENAVLGIQEKPLLGWGSKGYQALKQQQVAEKTMDKNALQFNDAHNQYLDSLVKRGIIGFLGLLAVLVIPLRHFISMVKNADLETKCISILGIAHIVAILFYFLSQTFLAHNSGSIFYFFLLVVLYALKPEKEQA